MKIKRILTSPGLTGFFFDDLEAIRRGAPEDGLFYIGDPVTPGFEAIRQPGESVSVMLILEDKQIAIGDCVYPQYAGVGGRDPPFKAKDLIPVIEKVITPRLTHRELTSFKELAEEIDGLKYKGKRLHNAILFGVQSAILDGVAKTRKLTMAEVIADEYGTTVSTKPMLSGAQTGQDRYNNVDKIIMKKADVMPHGLINTLELVGKDGQKLLEYVKWVRNRILTKGKKDYKPRIYIDVYGIIGRLFDNDIEKVAEFIGKVEEAAKPFNLWFEMPIDAGSTDGQIEAMKNLRKAVVEKGIKVRLIVDEWCTTFEDIKRFCDKRAVDLVKIKIPEYRGVTKALEAAIYARERSLDTWLATTCNETEIGTRVSVHMGLATGALLKMGTPGMGVDEGLMFVHNEQQRALALIKARSG